MHTRHQKMAQRAAEALDRRPTTESYGSFAKSFPALLQAAGLCQAAVYMKIKCRVLLEDVVYTALDDAPEIDVFLDRCRNQPVTEYMRLTRLTLDAATWIKRYVEAKDDESRQSSPADSEPSAIDAEELRISGDLRAAEEPG